ncbi:MAG: hypothetical protein OXG15_10930, partial [Gammaproteobacteria bacterium]|nr:hypothetical protein [Gammaproteobacteria bacterium]
MARSIPTKEEIEAVRDKPKEELKALYLQLVKDGENELAEHIEFIACYWHLDWFILRYIPKLATKPFKKYHLDILNAIPHGQRNRNINILAPRNSSKTTLTTLVYPLHRILYSPFDKIMGHYIEKFIVIMTQNKGKMFRRMRTLMNELEKNTLIRDDFGDRSAETGAWSNEEFLVRLGIGDVGTKEEECCAVLGLTRGMEIRGENVDYVRPTLILIDDIDVVDELRNPANREKDRDWFFADVMPAGVPEITNFMMIDTLKHEEALSANLMKNPAWYTIFLRAFSKPINLKPHPTAEPLWEKWENIYMNKNLYPNDRVRLEKAESFYEENKAKMNEGVDGLWPEMITYRMIREYICSRGYDYVMMEYQNSIEHTTSRYFEMNKAAMFTVEEGGVWVTDRRGD